MSRAGRRLNRAIKITPARDRDRYASEWRGDLESAAELGISPLEVARGATRAAWRLRLQHLGRSLSGAEGGRRATAAWALVVAILPIPLLFGGPLLLLVIPGSMVVALHLARQNPWRGTDIVMLGTLMLWLVCTVAFWWLWGVGFDAADANQPPPAGTQWAGPIFLVGLGAYVAFWAAFAVSVIRRASGAAPLDDAGQRVTGD
jgi:hypothetical protein